MSKQAWKPTPRLLGMPESRKNEILGFLKKPLFGIAKADGNVSSPELKKLLEFSNLLKISNADFQSIKAMFVDQVGGAYKILEIDKSDSDQKVKSAYRELAKKHHPDKVQHLGEAYVKAAQDKFQKIQKAYERIKAERGF